MKGDSAAAEGGFVCAQCGEGAPDARGACPACHGPVALEGRFALLRIVGQGAVGTTWKALDLRSEATVAVKEMPIRPGTPLHVRDRMAREARVLSQIEHPRIPAYVAHFEAGAGRHRAFYLVQAFVEGQTLAAEIADRRLSQVEVIAILDGVLEVLEYLHGLAPPIIHRDLKPGNVIRRASDGALVLIDFGAVKDVVNDPKVGGSTIAGTYGYMAPEQFKGVATAATDLYAVGAMAVGLLSRRDVLDLVGADHRLDWRPSVSAAPGMIALVERLLADDPAERPGSAKAVRAALAAVDVDAAAPARRRAAPVDRFAGLTPDLPKGAVQRLKENIAVDEPILWAARPHASAWRLTGCAPFVFAIPWTGFAVFWTVMAFVMSRDSGPFGYIFPLFGVPFILVGLGMLTAPLRARSKHRKTLYAVTDRQALEVRGPLWPRLWDTLSGDGVERYRGAALAGAERRDKGDGTSDFVIERIPGSKGRVTEKGLMAVADGDRVEALLRAAADYRDA